MAWLINSRLRNSICFVLSPSLSVMLKRHPISSDRLHSLYWDWRWQERIWCFFLVDYLLSRAGKIGKFYDRGAYSRTRDCRIWMGDKCIDLERTISTIVRIQGSIRSLPGSTTVHCQPQARGVGYARNRTKCSRRRSIGFSGNKTCSSEGTSKGTKPPKGKWWPAREAIREEGTGKAVSRLQQLAGGISRSYAK